MIGGMVRLLLFTLWARSTYRSTVAMLELREDRMDAARSGSAQDVSTSGAEPPSRPPATTDPPARRAGSTEERPDDVPGP
jgi:hypothetical protein